MVTESTVGIAMGMPPINSTRRFSIASRKCLRWHARTITSITMPVAIEQMQKFPMDVKT